jgi:hypothetical protein
MKLGCTRSEVRFVEKSESWGPPNHGTQILATIPAAVDRVYRASSLDRRTIWNSHDPYLTILDHDPTVRFPANPFVTYGTSQPAPTSSHHPTQYSLSVLSLPLYMRLGATAMASTGIGSTSQKMKNTACTDRTRKCC